ncbi:hypothetical protein [Aphanothece hegewaldii]|nr:hypothetical protein [Aphanothece hegewaldii]
MLTTHDSVVTRKFDVIALENQLEADYNASVSPYSDIKIDGVGDKHGRPTEFGLGIADFFKHQRRFVAITLPFLKTTKIIIEISTNCAQAG